MTCKACIDWGLKLIVYEDDSRVYAVCLCPVGERWRIASNNGRPCEPLWRVWAFQHGVDPTQVRMIEDVLEPQELAALGLSELTPATAMDAIASAARNRAKR